MKLVPPFTPIAKSYAVKYLVKSMLLFCTIADVRALRHPTLTVTSRSLVSSFGHLCSQNM